MKLIVLALCMFALVAMTTAAHDEEENAEVEQLVEKIAEKLAEESEEQHGSKKGFGWSRRRRRYG